MDEDMAPDEQAQSSNDEYIRSAHIPKVNLRQDWWKPLEEERPATHEPAWSILSSDLPIPTNNWASALASNYSPPPKDSLLAQTCDIATFIDWFCKRRGITELKPQDLEGPDFEIVKVFHPDVIHLQYQMEERHKLLTDSVDNPIIRHNISKPLPLGGPLVNAVRTHMRILNVVRIKVFSMYGYDYMKKIVLCRADLNEHVIAERDFKYLYPSDFEDLYLLKLQGHLNHLPPKDKKILTAAVNKLTRHLVIRQHVEDFQLGIESYQTQLNLTKPQSDVTGFEYKHDYTVIDSPRAQIDEALDYIVKEFRINRMNPGLNTRFWTRKDVDQSKAFMFAIQKRLKTRRIFRNLESFVGGRVRDGDYRLLKLCSSLRSLKPKRTFESRAKRSYKIISLGHYSIMLASSHTVKIKMEILLEPTSNKLLVANELTNAFGKPFEFLNNVFEHWVFNSLVHSFCALSALRRSGLRTASTGIPTVAAAGKKDVNSQLHVHTSNSLSMTRRQLKDLQHSFRNSDDRVKLLMKGTELSYQEQWKNFVTDVKLAKSLYTTNYDQLYTYLCQHERLANEVRITRERYPDPLALVANSSTLYNPSQSPQHSGEDPIECINKAMAFLSAVASRFPPSNNQPITSSNPRNQVTIQDGRVTVQQVQDKQTQSYAGTRNRGIATTSKGNYAADQPRVVKCYNCQGEGHVTIPYNSAFHTKDLDAYDSDCDDLSLAKAVLMENLSSCDPEVLSERIQPTLYDGSVIAKGHAVISVFDDEETLILEEESRSKMLDKQNDPISIEKKIKIFPIDYSKLNKIKEDFGKRLVTQKELSAEQAFWLKHPLHHIHLLELKLPVNFLRRPKATRSGGFSNKVKIVETKTSNSKEPKKSWGSTVFDVSSSSLNECSKYLGTVRFGNDHITKIIGYGDYQMGNVTISRVYYVEGLGYNLFSMGQFCDSDLEHQRLSHLNFNYITSLAKHGIVRGLPKLKYQKDHLCSACALSKSKKHSYKPKAKDFIQEKHYLLHMDLYGPMRVQSINGRKYILVIVDDFSRFTWMKFLPSKDEVPEFAEAVATTCYTKNRSLIQKRHNKTPYELLHDRKPDLSYLYVFGAFCYPTNDGEDLGKLKPKADIGIFVGYVLVKKAFLIYNKRTQMIIETIHVDFDKLTNRDGFQRADKNNNTI
nr:integrase, catalytic region, zinc finger, CCHC-type, peptidase aspartic, catalytic [Tanacetum cinerariifolium]